MPVGAFNLISRTEYARRRGVGESAVRRAIRDGRIALIDGKIDPVAADAQWAQNTRARHGGGAQPRGLEAEGARQRSEGAAHGGYLESRARREAAEAALAELRLAEASRKLIERDGVVRRLGTLIVACRERLLNCAPRLAPVLAAERDASRCFALVDEEIRAALDELTKAPDAV